MPSSLFKHPVCPYCGQNADLVTGRAVYPHRPDLYHLRFWMCVPCDAYVGCHREGAYMYVKGQKIISDGTLPLGRLANEQLRRAKTMAHDAFDPLWQHNGGTYRRRYAYKWLASKLGITQDECHIGDFDVQQCMRVVEIIKEQRGKPLPF